MTSNSNSSSSCCCCSSCSSSSSSSDSNRGRAARLRGGRVRPVELHEVLRNLQLATECAIKWYEINKIIVNSLYDK